jgi:hypothetical protein
LMENKGIFGTSWQLTDTFSSLPEMSKRCKFAE